jgi:hypothetical protein
VPVLAAGARTESPSGSQSRDLGAGSVVPVGTVPFRPECPGSPASPGRARPRPPSEPGRRVPGMSRAARRGPRPPTETRQSLRQIRVLKAPNPPDPVTLDNTPFPERGPNLKARLPNLPPMINSRHTAGPGGFPRTFSWQAAIPCRIGEALRAPARFSAKSKRGNVSQGWISRSGRCGRGGLSGRPSGPTLAKDCRAQSGLAQHWQEGGRPGRCTWPRGALRLIAPTPRLHQE